MKSEAKANQDMLSYAERTAWEREQWERVLKAPVKPTIRKQVKQGFFSKLFKGV